ncbi:hypothetical protein [Neisseria blantyrii]|nr:hypothetical protein [Neisseria blantyrii]
MTTDNQNQETNVTPSETQAEENLPLTASFSENFLRFCAGAMCLFGLLAFVSATENNQGGIGFGFLIGSVSTAALLNLLVGISLTLKKIHNKL